MIFDVMLALSVTLFTAAMSEVLHETVYFTGHVQGVGFRYATLQVAKEFEVTGFVRNLPDGRVHLEVEGEKPEIEAFLRGLADAHSAAAGDEHHEPQAFRCRGVSRS